MTEKYYRISPASTLLSASERVCSFCRPRVHIDRHVILETIASLQAFRKRHSEAQRLHAQYSGQPTTVDLARYRSILKNTAIVDEAEKLLKDFKPVTYDVSAHVKAIETFEAKAVSRRVQVPQKKG